MIGKYIIVAIIGGVFGALLGYFGKCTTGACPLTANPYRGAIYGIVMGLLLVSMFVKKPKSQSGQKIQKDDNSLQMQPVDGSAIDINSKLDFQTQILNNEGICLVDMFSHQCPPCRALSPMMSSLAKTYAGKVAVCKVNVDNHPAIAKQYRIHNIPTVLIIKNGKEVKRLSGLRPATEYTAILNEIIEKYAS